MRIRDRDWGKELHSGSEHSQLTIHGVPQCGAMGEWDQGWDQLQWSWQDYFAMIAW